MPVKNFTFILIISLLFAAYVTTAQNVTITPSGITPEISATHPRLSYDNILALPTPEIGDIAYDLTFMCLRVYNGTKWICTFQNPAENSPNIAIVNTAGGALEDVGSSIVVDASGNVYITGYFAGTANFSGISKTSMGSFDIFVAKYSSSGTLQWVQTAGGSSFDLGISIVVDLNGNVIITGRFQETVNFGNISKTAFGNYDIFVAKYNNFGALQWVQTAGGIGSDVGNDISVDASGSVFITGSFSETANFGGIVKTSAGNTDIFLAKYNSEGAFQFVQTVGGASFDFGNSIVVDDSGKILISGSFEGNVNFGITSKTSAGNSDIFVAKYDPINSSFLWVQAAGGAGYDGSTALATDNNENIFITGYFVGTANFSSNSKVSTGLNDIFIVKYNSSGGFQWVQTVGGASTDFSNDVSVDADGNLFIVGSFEETATFSTVSKITTGSYDVFVVKYNNFGNLQWVQSIGGISSDFGSSISVNTNKNLFITGRFGETANFGAVSLTSAGDSDIFVVRIQE